MNEPTTVLERLSVAIKSGNLHVSNLRRTDVDYIIALGAAENRQARSQNPVVAACASAAGQILHLHVSGSRVAYKSALASVRSLAEHLNTRKHWELEEHQVRRVAELALAHHIAPVCPTCNGQAFKLIAGAPVKSEHACPTCDGTGMRPLPRRNRQEIRQVISSLEVLDSVLSETVSRLLRN